MAKTVSLKVYNQAGEEVSKMTASAEVYGIEPNNQAMFDAVNVYLSNRRQATAKTKVRHEVSGGGKKPWRQKGTGHARAGSSRSPIWVGGGTVFGPVGTQNYKLSQNKSEHNVALRSALSQKVNEKEFKVVEDLNVEAKTKNVLAVLKALKAGKKVLIVSEGNEKLDLAAANISSAKVVVPSNVSVYDLLNADSVVITKEAVKKLEEALE